MKQVKQPGDEVDMTMKVRIRPDVSRQTCEIIVEIPEIHVAISAHGKINTNRENVDLRTLLRSVANRASEAINEQGFSITSDEVSVAIEEALATAIIQAL